VDVATHNGLLNVYFFFSSFMFGMTNATSTRMAIHIGMHLKICFGISNSVVKTLKPLGVLCLRLPRQATDSCNAWERSPNVVNELNAGAGSIPQAKHVLRIGLAAGLLIGVGVGAGFALLRNQIGKIYSDSPEVWAATAPLCVLLAGLYLLTAFLYVSFATIDAQGRPIVLAVAFVVGAWGVSVPLA
jgi:Na+-driven multidrug efflux pump